MSDAFFIQQFETYLRAEKKMSAHTVTAYSADIRACLAYAEAEFALQNIGDLTHLFIKSWLSGLMSDGMDARSVRRKISALKTYYRYLLRHQLVDYNPMLKVSSPKVSKKLPNFIEASKMEVILDIAEAKKNEKNDAIAQDIVLTLYHTGVRLSELINLEKRHISLSQSLLKVTGKRNKERLIPMTAELSTILQPYLELHPESPFVFNTSSGKKLYPNFVYRVVKDLLSAGSTQRKNSPHVLRHTFATHLLNNGGDLNAIKELLGHANLSATQVYTHNSVERLKTIHKQAHPKGRLK